MFVLTIQNNEQKTFSIFPHSKGDKKIMNSYTHITYVLDRSGSMDNVRRDIKAGLKSYIDEQKKQEGKCTFSLVQFDDCYDKHYWFHDIQTVSSTVVFEPRGGTALFDAVGKAILETGKELKNMPEELRPQKVLMIIHTDGYENMSREFSRTKIKEMIQHQEEKYNWKIAFVGTNIDVMSEGSSMGMNVRSCLSYVNDSHGIDTAYASISNATSSIRNMSTSAYVTTNDFFGNTTTATTIPTTEETK